MTTKVTIQAHCAYNKEVEIVLTENEALIELKKINDGESHELYVYDGRSVQVHEKIKT